MGWVELTNQRLLKVPLDKSYDYSYNLTYLLTVERLKSTRPVGNCGL